MTEEEFFEVVHEGALAHLNLLVRVQRAYYCLQYMINQASDGEAIFRRWCDEETKLQRAREQSDAQRQREQAAMRVEQEKREERDDDWTD